jgi:hypothetical protein
MKLTLCGLLHGWKEEYFNFILTNPWGSVIIKGVTFPFGFYLDGIQRRKNNAKKER